MKHHYRFLCRLFILAILFNLSACVSPTTSSPEPIATTAQIAVSTILSPTSPLPGPTPSAAEQFTPTPTNNTAQLSIWIDPTLPEGVSGALKRRSEIQTVETPTTQSIRIQVGSENVVSRWVYALTAPFPTIADDMSAQNLLDAWKTGKSDDQQFQKLLVSQNTLDLFSKLWGAPAPDFVMVLPSDQIIDRAWKDQTSWAIIPFDQIQPRWKIISVDGLSPLRKDFQIEKYALTAPVSVLGPPDSVATYLKNFGPDSPAWVLPATNRDPSKLSTVILTGVTALVRGTAATMFLKGITYPGQDIRGILREADILHVSNEIPFTPKCPNSQTTTKLVFCTRPEYIGLLEDIGTDIVELSGDHFQDWGPDAVLYTIDMYNQRGWKYYGGGKNLEDGRKPLLLENNGNKIAFIGCNGKAPGYAGASATSPGAVHCNMPYMTDQIKQLRQQGYLPIVTFQHEEVWTYKADKALKPDFEAAADAGAVIVSGSQAHQPQAFEFRGSALIHYGLGNLFFDQVYEGLPTRQAFIDRHVFYDGKYLGVDLITIMFVDLARPRLMTPPERADLLNTIFKVSIW